MENEENRPRFGEVQPEQPAVDTDVEQPTESSDDNLPEIAEPPKKPDKNKPQGRLQQWKQWYIERKKLTIPLSVLLLILILAAIPPTRYAAAGPLVHKSVTVAVQDQKTHTPVSGAKVSIGNVTATTNGQGQATLAGVSVGHHKATVTKTYYKDNSLDVLVPIFSQKKVPSVAFTATGRQVKITIKNYINQQPVEGAKIAFDDSTSVTDNNGETLAVVPADATIQAVTISAKGFNTEKAGIPVSDTEVKDTAVEITPAGKIYFLSKLSGKIDVVKTDLDGAGRKTVLAGTGKEDDRNTVLLASRDWDHLALLSARDGAAKLFIINTDSDDNLVMMDQSDSEFTPIGWYDHYFVYKVARHGYNNWQANAVSIKSYNADNGKILTLVNNNATGSSNADAMYETLEDINFVGEDLVYNKTWYKNPGYLQVEGKQDGLYSIRPDGSNAHPVKLVDAASSYVSNVRLNKPRELQFSTFSNSGNDSTTFIMDKNGNVNQTNTDKNYYDKPELSYLESPASEQTFWYEPRDGKNSLFIGDKDASNPKEIAKLSGFTTYGWYSDKYLLVSKSSSELYILPASGIGTDNEAKKVTDYHKPALNFSGYGGGYGGL